jgi:2,4-dienoyl-CoA reductase-like NADH-dependent reductase (Old Yellow Enzyme family)/thioredoxin reductase
MRRKYPNLSRSIKIGEVYFRNRMFGAPMGGTDITADCTIGPRSIAFYELRAKGGAANVTVSELVVHPETEASHMYHLDLKTPDSLASFTYTADAIRRHGAIASVELSHSGQYAGTYLIDKDKKQDLTQWGPSDGRRPDGRPVKELTQELIQDIVKAYGEKAALAKKAGFEMVMVHGGHGWLINQFLSPYFNKRKDQYGGRFNNRMRFTKEILESIRLSVGPGFPIEFRMSGSELFEGGYGQKEGIKIAEYLDDKIDLLHVSAGTYLRGFGKTHPSMFSVHGPNVYLAEEIKKHVSIPVATVGGLNDPEKMEQIIESGKADIVVMARALLADPELPKKIVTNSDDKIIQCLRCFTCMSERAETSTRRCAVNPLIGREIDGIEIVKAANKKKVLVVGAGPGGLQAAITAARRGHKAILCEKNGSVGGILVGEQALPFKYKMYRLGLSMEKIAKEENVEIRLNTPVDKAYAEKESADVVIVAAGSKPFLPPIKGIDQDHVFVVNDYHLKSDQVQNQVVVLGGGLAGCEIALHLSNEGKEVKLIEMTDTLAPDANIRHRPLLINEIKTSDINVYKNHRGTIISENGVLCETLTGEEILIKGRTIICALGQEPRRDVVDQLADAAPIVMTIGDCAKVSNITTAIYQGHHAGMDV